MPRMRDVSGLTRFLEQTPFFGGLGPSQMRGLIAMTVERTFPKGSTVFNEGDQGTSMYVVQSGELAATRSGESGRPVKLMRLSPGDFFGETTLIEMQPRPFSVLVEKHARLLELSTRDLYRLYQTDVQAYVLVLQNINRELCRRLRRASRRLTEYAERAGDELTLIRETGPVDRKT
jgi:CRP-like cAMP-binding protein